MEDPTNSGKVGSTRSSNSGRGKSGKSGRSGHSQRSTASTRWSKESDLGIRHPGSVHSKQLPKILVWKDLFVSVPVETGKWFKKKEEKTRCVIKGVSGVAEAGQILAIMGESGAGKTTLLNVLTQRNKRSLQIEGEVSINGEAVGSEDVRKISAFVQQFDLFLGSMTVREHLVFCAHLRMGREFTTAERMEKVDQVIGKMGLEVCQNTRIGQKFTKSISLGEKKRLAFASELLNDPALIFCDEPTSGLDAFMAKQVISCLKQLAKEDGRTIIITIHQPSSQVFEMIDRVCFMAAGQVAYFGPTKKVPAFFASIGLMMPSFVNPAEFAIKCLSMHEGEKKEVHLERVEEISESYKNSALAEDFHERTHGPVSERRRAYNEDLHDKSRYNASWFSQFWWVFKRSFYRTLRDPLMIKVRLVHVLLTATFISIVYFQSKIKENTIMNADGLMYNVVRDSYFLYMFPCILVFTEELPVFLRENHAQIYRTDAYFIAKNLAEVPQGILLPILYATLIYFVTNMMGYGALKYLHFISIAVFSSFTALSIGYAAACIFALPEIAVQFTPMMNFPLLALAGFFVRLKSVKVYMKPLAYISWFRYSFEALMINLWHDRGTIDGCEVVNGTMAEACNGSSTGPNHLTMFDFHTSIFWIWGNMGILMVIALFFRSVAVIALMIRTRVCDG